MNPVNSLSKMQGLRVSEDKMKHFQDLNRGQLMDKKDKQHSGRQGSLLALGVA